MADESEGRAILESRLAHLLGFDEGASDLLDHLLSIESSQDLSDYLSQLLGSDNKEVKNFLEDVFRYRRGERLEPLVIAAKNASATDGSSTQPIAAPSAKPSAAKLTPLSSKNHAVVAKHQPKNQQSSFSKPEAAKKQIPKSAAFLPPVQTMQAPIVKSSVSKTAKSNPPTSKQSDKILDHPKKQEDRPQRGKALYTCGCFGNLHKALSNCLHCGRISCEREGYGYCPFCGYLVEEVRPPQGEAASTDKAWLHKERLLQYDREFAQRTVVLDDQSDFYTNSVWLSDEEKAVQAQQEAEHQERIQKRALIQLKLDI